ncbi:MAG: hypothetical protein WD490_08265 [Opitutales bacterium]
MEESGVDTEEKRVYAHITEFSTFGVFGEAPANFEEWMANQPSMFQAPEELQDPGDTPAGDGVENLLKYALGVPPMESAAGSLPVAKIEEAEGKEYLTLSFDKNPYAAGIEYTVEISSDFEQWESGAGNVDIIEETGARMTARDAIPVGDEERRSMRLLVNPIEEAHP